MPSPDPIQQLQAAARLVASRHIPGAIPARVAILGPDEKPLFVVAVPQAGCEPDESRREPPVNAGWDVDGRRALFDGRSVKVAPSRLKLLQALAAAEGPLAARDLIDLAFDRHTSEANVRFHVAELRKELRAAFPGFEEDPVESTGAGYSLAVR